MEKYGIKKIFIYELPLAFVNVLQFLFGAANTAVIGSLITDTARADAAVGAITSTTTIVALALAFATGMQIAVNAIVARCVGEKKQEKAGKIAGTATLLGFSAGVVLGAIGVIFARVFLLLTKNDSPEILQKATLYLRIYFAGFPFIITFNVLSAVLRSVGDTVRPSVYLASAILLNFLLSVFFTTVFNVDVEGAAVATVLSQAFAAGLALVRCAKNEGYGGLKLKNLRFFKPELLEIVKTALPVVFHTAAFSLTGIIVQSKINGFGETYITGYGIAVQIDNIFYQIMVGVAVAALAFAAEARGESNLKAIKKTLFFSSILIAVIGVLTAAFIFTAGRAVCGIFSKTPEVVDVAMQRLTLLSLSYTLCGLVEVFSNVFRGIGKVTSSMVIGVICQCVLKVVLINAVAAPSFAYLMNTFTVCWCVALAVYLAGFLIFVKKEKRRGI